VCNTVDTEYIAAVDRWMSILFAYIKPYLYANGGPIIMVQVRNIWFHLYERFIFMNLREFSGIFSLTYLWLSDNFGVFGNWWNSVISFTLEDLNQRDISLHFYWQESLIDIFILEMFGVSVLRVV